MLRNWHPGGGSLHSFLEKRGHQVGISNEETREVYFKEKNTTGRNDGNNRTCLPKTCFSGALPEPLSLLTKADIMLKSIGMFSLGKTIPSSPQTGG